MAEMQRICAFEEDASAMILYWLKAEHPELLPFSVANRTQSERRGASKDIISRLASDGTLLANLVSQIAPDHLPPASILRNRQRAGRSAPMQFSNSAIYDRTGLSSDTVEPDMYHAYNVNTRRVGQALCIAFPILRLQCGDSSMLVHPALGLEHWRISLDKIIMEAANTHPWQSLAPWLKLAEIVIAFAMLGHFRKHYVWRICQSSVGEWRQAVARSLRVSANILQWPENISDMLLQISEGVAHSGTSQSGTAQSVYTTAALPSSHSARVGARFPSTHTPSQTSSQLRQQRKSSHSRDSRRLSEENSLKRQWTIGSSDSNLSSNTANSTSTKTNSTSTTRSSANGTSDSPISDKEPEPAVARFASSVPRNGVTAPAARLSPTGKVAASSSLQRSSTADDKAISGTSSLLMQRGNVATRKPDTDLTRKPGRHMSSNGDSHGPVFESNLKPSEVLSRENSASRYNTAEPRTNRGNESNHGHDANRGVKLSSEIDQTSYGSHFVNQHDTDDSSSLTKHMLSSGLQRSRLADVPVAPLEPLDGYASSTIRVQQGDDDETIGDRKFSYVTNESGRTPSTSPMPVPTPDAGARALDAQLEQMDNSEQTATSDVAVAADDLHDPEQDNYIDLEGSQEPVQQQPQNHTAGQDSSIPSRDPQRDLLSADDPWSTPQALSAANYASALPLVDDLKEIPGAVQVASPVHLSDNGRAQKAGQVDTSQRVHLSEHERSIFQEVNASRDHSLQEQGSAVDAFSMSDRRTFYYPHEVEHEVISARLDEVKRTQRCVDDVELRNRRDYSTQNKGPSFPLSPQSADHSSSSPTLSPFEEYPSTVGDNVVEALSENKTESVGGKSLGLRPDAEEDRIHDESSRLQSRGQASFVDLTEPSPRIVAESATSNLSETLQVGNGVVPAAEDAVIDERHESVDAMEFANWKPRSDRNRDGTGDSGFRTSAEHSQQMAPSSPNEACIDAVSAIADAYEAGTVHPSGGAVHGGPESEPLAVTVESAACEHPQTTNLVQADARKILPVVADDGFEEVLAPVPEKSDTGLVDDESVSFGDARSRLVEQIDASLSANDAAAEETSQDVSPDVMYSGKRGGVRFENERSPDSGRFHDESPNMASLPEFQSAGARRSSSSRPICDSDGFTLVAADADRIPVGSTHFGDDSGLKLVEEEGYSAASATRWANGDHPSSVRKDTEVLESSSERLQEEIAESRNSELPVSESLPDAFAEHSADVSVQLQRSDGETEIYSGGRETATSITDAGPSSLGNRENLDFDSTPLDHTGRQGSEDLHLVASEPVSDSAAQSHASVPSAVNHAGASFSATNTEVHENQDGQFLADQVLPEETERDSTTEPRSGLPRVGHFQSPKPRFYRDLFQESRYRATPPTPPAVDDLLTPYGDGAFQPLPRPVSTMAPSDSLFRKLIDVWQSHEDDVASHGSREQLVTDSAAGRAPVWLSPAELSTEASTLHSSPSGGRASSSNDFDVADERSPGKEVLHRDRNRNAVRLDSSSFASPKWASEEVLECSPKASPGADDTRVKPSASRDSADLVSSSPHSSATSWMQDDEVVANGDWDEVLSRDGDSRGGSPGLSRKEKKKVSHRKLRKQSRRLHANGAGHEDPGNDFGSAIEQDASLSRIEHIRIDRSRLDWLTQELLAARDALHRKDIEQTLADKASIEQREELLLEKRDAEAVVAAMRQLLKEREVELREARQRLANTIAAASREAERHAQEHALAEANAQVEAARLAENNSVSMQQGSSAISGHQIESQSEVQNSDIHDICASVIHGGEGVHSSRREGTSRDTEGVAERPVVDHDEMRRLWDEVRLNIEEKVILTIDRRDRELEHLRKELDERQRIIDEISQARLQLVEEKAALESEACTLAAEKDAEIARRDIQLAETQGQLICVTRLSKKLEDTYAETEHLRAEVVESQAKMAAVTSSSGVTSRETRELREALSRAQNEADKWRDVAAKARAEQTEALHRADEAERLYQNARNAAVRNSFSKRDDSDLSGSEPSAGSASPQRPSGAHEGGRHHGRPRVAGRNGGLAVVSGNGSGAPPIVTAIRNKVGEFINGKPPRHPGNVGNGRTRRVFHGEGRSRVYGGGGAGVVGDRAGRSGHRGRRGEVGIREKESRHHRTPAETTWEGSINGEERSERHERHSPDRSDQAVVRRKARTPASMDDNYGTQSESSDHSNGSGDHDDLEYADEDLSRREKLRLGALAKQQVGYGYAAYDGNEPRAGDFLG